jgi:2-(1,2-epoxy-1,2-dihydrophenyl)acetyl-CoA isomerase
MSAQERVVLSVDDGLAHLRLVWVDGHNAIDPAMVAALGRAVDAIAADASVRAVLVSADGRSFTVGGDLRHFAGHVDDLAGELERMVGPYHRTLTQLGGLAVPVVCAAQGPTAGGGLGLLWCADLVLVADDVKLAAGFPRLALSGDGGSSWALPRLVGLRRAQRFLMGGLTLGAAEAVEWGIASEVVPAAELAGRALAEARRLADGPTLALGHMRQLLRGAGAVDWDEHLQRELTAMRECGASADAREGVASFGERRAPAFRGR